MSDLDVIGENRRPLTGPRYYDESKNPERGELPGVPLRDLTAAEFEALPVWLQYSVDAQSCYRKTKPPAETAPLRGAAATASADDAAGKE